MAADAVSAEELEGLARNAPLTRPRPGHADLAGMQKYGFEDARPILERASARETAARVALGAVAKGGTSNLQAVYEYAEKVDQHGFVYMDTPGYDPVSATGQVAGGANLICFTTGRGSAYGCAPSPSLKLATNTALWDRQADDIDINCGDIIDGQCSVQEKGLEIFQKMLARASGEPSKSENHGYGQNEFVPWQLGAVM